MGLLTPPSGDRDPTIDMKASPESPKPEKDIKTQFHTRPSLGLTLWGPLVPASDNKSGLWTLVTAQTMFSLFFIGRFRALAPKVIKRDIAEFPSLNRFSTSSGNMYVPTFSEFGGPHSFHSRVSPTTGFVHSKRFINFRRALYLVTGSLLLAQSMLEASRLLLLEYDPWEEQARSVREKQFFNDVVKFYHEGVDPMRFKVKDATSGTTLSVNIPEVKQGLAVARAHGNAENLVTKWLGPLDYKPLSFSEFLDKLEHYLNMSDFLHNVNSKKSLQDTEGILRRQRELSSLEELNKANREKVRLILNSSPPNSLPLSVKASEQGIRGVTMDVNVDTPEDIDLHELWSMYNPWVDLALDTSLSIKFLPTVRTPQELAGEGEEVVEVVMTPAQKENDSTPKRVG